MCLTYSDTNIWNSPSTLRCSGPPPQVVTLASLMSMPAGVGSVAKRSHCRPSHAASQSQAPERQSPFKEQSRSLWHAAASPAQSSTAASCRPRGASLHWRGAAVAVADCVRWRRGRAPPASCRPRPRGSNSVAWRVRALHEAASASGQQLRLSCVSCSQFLAHAQLLAIARAARGADVAIPRSALREGKRSLASAAAASQGRTNGSAQASWHLFGASTGRRCVLWHWQRGLRLAALKAAARGRPPKRLTDANCPGALRLRWRRRDAW